MNNDFRRKFLRKLVSQFFLAVFIVLSVIYYLHIKIAYHYIVIILAALFVWIVVRNYKKMN